MGDVACHPIKTRDLTSSAQGQTGQLIQDADVFKDPEAPLLREGTFVTDAANLESCPFTIG